MVIAAAALALGVVIILVWSVGIAAQKETKKRNEAQKKEIQNIIKVVDTVAAGQTAAERFGLTWIHEDVLKAQGNKQYVPFTVAFDPSKVTGGTAALYWRVVAKSAAPAAAPDPAKKDEKKDEKKKPDTRTRTSASIPAAAGQKPMRVSRSFTVPAGHTTCSSS